MYEGMHVKLSVCAYGAVAVYGIRECGGFLGIVSNISYFAKNLVLKFLKLVEILSFYIPINSKTQWFLLPQMCIKSSFL